MTEYEKAKARIEEIEQAWKELEEEYSELRTIVEEYETQNKEKEFIIEQVELCNKFAKKFPYGVDGNKIDFKEELEPILKPSNVKEVVGSKGSFGWLFCYSSEGYPCMSISYYGGGTLRKYFRTKASAKEYRDRRDVVRNR